MQSVSQCVREREAVDDRALGFVCSYKCFENYEGVLFLAEQSVGLGEQLQVVLVARPTERGGGGTGAISPGPPHVQEPHEAFNFVTFLDCIFTLFLYFFAFSGPPLPPLLSQRPC